MDKMFLAPKEIAQATINAGAGKAKLSIVQMIILGAFAGVYIGLGGQGAITISQTYGAIDLGMSKFLFAAAFPVGLMLVVICGAELFTGNNLMIMGCLNGNYSTKDLLRNWVTVYIANFVGSVILAILVANSGLMTGAAAEKAIGIANAKVAIPFMEAVIRGLLCNVVVVLAVWMATAGKDIISKIFACWFPIMLFVLCGFEHSVANMYFAPLGMFLGAPINWGQIWINNLIPVTIGNIIGGAFIVGVLYLIAYIKPDAQQK
ncbi:MAG: formate/nitrite transporter family protein [Firmicutes bacterium]|nr:formate/nitrite transporter family protein [Bacillota bacterium]